MRHTIFLLLLLPISLFAQKNVGIGTANPASRLHIHQDPSGSNPPSTLQMTSNSSGASTTDGLKMEMSGQSGSVLNQEYGNLSLGTSNVNRLHLLANGDMGYNTTQSVGSADFTIRSKGNFFGGIFIDSPNSNDDGKPFYGYSLDRQTSMYHYFDAVDEKLKFQFSNQNNITFSFQKDGVFLLNTDTPVNSYVDLTLRTRGVNSFGGMFIDSPISLSNPTYGYSILGDEKALHYYNDARESWILNTSTIDALVVQDDGNVGLGEYSPDERLVINGLVRLKAAAPTANNQNGTILFNGANFWAKIQGSWWPMTNPVPNTLAANPDNPNVAKLQSENAELRQKLENMEERLLKLEAAITKI